jgi:acyl-CoA thioesterase FadM
VRRAGIAFNANYLVYVDETIDRWITDTLGEEPSTSW